MFRVDPGTIAILIPIIAVLGGMTIAVIAIIMNSRQEELKHKERLLAMEKGIELPEAPKEEKRPAYLSLRAWGFIVTFVGIAILISSVVANGIGKGIWGLVPTAVGIGFLLAAALEKRDVEKK
jgi:hypothetical protein